MVLQRKGKAGWKIALAVALLIVVLGAVAWWLLAGTNIAVLNPKGSIAGEQRDLMVIATLLMLLVVIPVFVMTFGIAWKYREGNTKAKYQPDWDHSRTAEAAWWLIPFAIIAVLSVITWKSTHQLDPHRPIASDKDALTIQVVALQWKWLFIYPDQNVATVNYLKVPVDRPLAFNITSDAPMNSFWIPQLGGQIYAMAGMNTKLHLIADEAGTYDGTSANISGEGFAGMTFKVEAVPENEFNNWIATADNNVPVLDVNTYNKLAKPSLNNPRATYAADDNSLYDTVILKYLDPSKGGAGHREQEDEGYH